MRSTSLTAVPGNREPDIAAMPDDIATHPMSIGDIVTILAFDALGRPFIEGVATIETLGHQPHLYRVRFRGDPVIRSRFVGPDWQADPQRALTILTALWRSAQLPQFDDFFPPNLG